MKTVRVLRERVCSAQARIDGLSADSSNASALLRLKLKESARFWEKMNFRERYLNGWFGGDKVKVRDRRNLEREISALRARIRRIAKKSDSFDRKLMEHISAQLSGSDDSYRKLLEVRKSLEKLKKSADWFGDKIDRALSEIDEAQGMETLDLVTKNKGIAMMSYFENSEANEAIREVSRSAPAFQKAMDEYNGFLKGRKFSGSIVAIDDGIDLVLDLIFDGFDFSSFFTLSALNNAEEKMKEARNKVSRIRKVVDESFRKAKSVESIYLKKVRSECLK